jgi:glutaredoxin
MAQASPDAFVIKAYWQPGCTSCLRMKEFLIKRGVAFVSVNVLENKDAFAELAALGIRSVPIVRRGQDWANGHARGGARCRRGVGRDASAASA